MIIELTVNNNEWLMKRAQTTFQINSDRTKNVIDIFFFIIAFSLAVPACFVSPVIDTPWVRDLFVSVSSRGVLIQFINLNKIRRHPSSFFYIRNVLQKFCKGMRVSILISNSISVVHVYPSAVLQNPEAYCGFD